MHLSSVLLPEPFSPMRPNVEPCGDLERHVVERPELLVAVRPPALQTAAFSDWLRSWYRRKRFETSSTTIAGVAHSSSARRPSSASKTTQTDAATAADSHATQQSDVGRRREPGCRRAGRGSASTKCTIGFRSYRQATGTSDPSASSRFCCVGDEDDRVDDRRQVEPHLQHDRDEVLDVAEVDVGDAEHQREHRARTAPGSRIATSEHAGSHGSDVGADEQEHHGEHAELDRGTSRPTASDRRPPRALAREVDLLTRLALATKEVMPRDAELAKKFHGSRPQSRKNAKT